VSQPLERQHVAAHRLATYKMSQLAVAIPFDSFILDASVRQLALSRWGISGEHSSVMILDPITGNSLETPI
jgi:hypothetical protein